MSDTEGKTILIDGRIVWTSGDLFKGKLKLDQNTQQPRINAKGEPMMEHGFGLAVPKANIQEFWNAIHEEAFKLYPSRQLPPGFAFKYKDGDGVDHNGQPFSTREGHAGCLVLACTTSLAIKYFKFENGTNIQVADGIKCGDFVKVQLTIKAHPPKGAGKAGLYLNPSAVQFLGYGKEIVNAPSGDQLFGNQAPALPPGAQAMPTAPPTTGIPGFAQPVQQQGYAQPQVQPQVMPHYQVLPQAHQPPAGGQPMAAPMAPGVPQQQNFGPASVQQPVPQGYPAPQMMPPMGNVSPAAAYPAPAAPMTPTAPPMAAPSGAMPAPYAQQPGGFPPLPQ
jgi:hypothetical protein